MDVSRGTPNIWFSGKLLLADRDERWLDIGEEEDEFVKLLIRCRDDDVGRSDAVVLCWRLE